MVARGLLASLLLVGSGWLTAPLPRSLWVVQHTPLGAARAAAAGPGTGPVALLALLGMLAGVGLLAQAWLTLWRRCGDDLPHRVAHTRLAAAAWGLPLLLAPPLFSRDAWSYAAQGALAAAGLSPYDHGPSVLAGTIRQGVDPLWRHTPAPYGPVPLWWGDLLAHHTADPLLLVLGHRLLAGAGLVLLGLSVPPLAVLAGGSPARASALVLASPMVLVDGVGGLHNDLLMIGLMAAAVAVTARHWALGAALAGAAAAVKLPGGLAAVGVVLLSLPAGAPLTARVRRGLGAAVVSAAVLFGTGWVSGLGSGWVHTLGVPLVPTALSPMGMLGAPGRVVGTLAPVLLGAVALLRAPTGRPGRVLPVLGVLALVVVLLLPAVRLWYLLWPLPFLAAARLPARAETALAAGAIGLGIAAPVASAPIGPALSIAVLAGMAAVATAGIAVLARRRTLTVVP